MRLIHFSDTHLGYAEYSAADPETGVNLRETDFYLAFRKVVEEICARKPDFAVHAGDLFDTVRPTNRAIAEAIAGFRRILDAGVELVVIAGNHETPKIRSTGNIFKALEAALPGAHFACDGTPRVFRLRDAAVHAIPDAAEDAKIEAALDSLRPAPGVRNIAVLHAGVRRLEGKVQSGEFNQHFVPLERIASLARFDYVALGHYHRAMPVEGASNAWYCGSTERTGFDEARNAPGFLEVSLDPLEVVPASIQVRPMLDLGAVHCAGLTHEQVLGRLAQALEGKIDGAVARIVLDGISARAASALPREELARLRKPALHCEIVLALERTGDAPSCGPLSFGSLPDEFSRFMAARKLEKGYDRERLLRLGQEILARACREEPE